MLIDCPHCAAGYDLDVAELAEGGFIRCAHCRTMWTPSVSDPPATGPQKHDTRSPAIIVLEAELRARDTQQPSLVDCDVFYEEITRPLEPPSLTPAPEIFRYEPGRPRDALPDATPNVVAPEYTPERAPAEPFDQPTAEAEIVSVRPAVEPASSETFADLEAFARKLSSRAGDTPAEPPPPLRLVANQAAVVKPKTKRSRWPFVATGLAAAIAGLIVWRVEVVRAAPQTAGLYAALRLPVNVRGLSFGDVRTVQEKQDGVDVLVVTGSIANATKKPIAIPRLRMALLDAGGAEVFTWATTAGKASLAAGETLPFRSRLASPPANAQDILVRFVNRRDTATP